MCIRHSTRAPVLFFFKQKTAYEISACLVGSEMCIRDRYMGQAFSLEYGYFVEAGDKTLIPNPHPQNRAEAARFFEFLGRITGKALYEGLVIESVFSRLFLNKVLGRDNNLDEMRFLDEEVYKNLIYLKSNPCIEGLTFSVTENRLGEITEHPLKPGGDKIPVTEENKLEYVFLFTDYKLNKSIEEQSQAFLRGLTALINPHWLEMFNHEELQLLISGPKGGFDVNDFKRNVRLSGFYDLDSTIINLWAVLDSYSKEEREDFLRFITGCPRPPISGFKYMQPQIVIERMQISENDENKLPTSSTCNNTLRLPPYSDALTLRTKLTYAIKSNSGFELA
eukprot:TRINITY_DN1383_c0_g1_i1.p1 TRINITY_DN1383_c0_g1~~TRINITY_DN1383_c0_g1_i1.p1  ORF type:complete len:337 (-),score=58.44 TRINITY_DN1383_c0_g1_i1:126-1136(-)